MYLPLRTLAATTKALLEMLSLKLINLDRIYIQKKKTNHVNSLYRIPDDVRPSQWGLFRFLSRRWQREERFSCIGLGCWYLRYSWYCIEHKVPTNRKSCDDITHTLGSVILRAGLFSGGDFRTVVHGQRVRQEKKMQILVVWTGYSDSHPQELIS